MSEIETADKPVVALPRVEDHIYIEAQGRIFRVRVTAVNRVDEMVAVHGIPGLSGWFIWEQLAPEQKRLQDLYDLGEDVVD